MAQNEVAQERLKSKGLQMELDERARLAEETDKKLSSLEEELAKSRFELKASMQKLQETSNELDEKSARMVEMEVSFAEKSVAVQTMYEAQLNALRAESEKQTEEHESQLAAKEEALLAAEQQLAMQQKQREDHEEQLLEAAQSLAQAGEEASERDCKIADLESRLLRQQRKAEDDAAIAEKRYDDLVKSAADREDKEKVLDTVRKAVAAALKQEEILVCGAEWKTDKLLSLQAAIGDCSNVEIHSTEFEAYRLVYDQEARKRQMREVLELASRSPAEMPRDQAETMLKQAMESGMALGLLDEELESASVVWLGLMQKEEARESMRISKELIEELRVSPTWRTNRLESLEAALEDATKAGLPETELMEFEELVIAERAKRSAREGLDKALHASRRGSAKGGSPKAGDKIAMALRRAQTVGLTFSELKTAETLQLVTSGSV
eukprot:TRINITY_DN14948_c1_g1_i1.p1 TRINITY_DN14948_c1_g1~~TRINITY_DN14948_c1_g1_i1.p1  ORF type:complete len:460 (-),score=130.71 TRINITY_DN14948_c1_g1_i1:315-1634(-)